MLFVWGSGPMYFVWGFLHAKKQDTVAIFLLSYKYT